MRLLPLGLLTALQSWLIFCVTSFEYQPQSLKSYHNYTEMTESIMGLQEKYPDMVLVYSIGQSVKGRHLWVTRISTEVKFSKGQRQKRKVLKPWVKIVSNMHGNEVIGRELSLALVDYLLEGYSNSDPVTKRLLSGIDLHILHSMNPDGFEVAAKDCHGVQGRTNANDVDLNRDFPTYFDLLESNNISEILHKRQPETKAVAKWIVQNPFTLSMNFHDGATVVSYPFDDFYSRADAIKPRYSQGKLSRTPEHDLILHLAKSYASKNPKMRHGVVCEGIQRFKDGITNGAEWYVVRGGMQDFNYHFSNCIEVTFELSCCKYPDAKNLTSEWRNNLESILTFLQMAHMGIKGRVTNKATGKPIQGALVEVQSIKNPSITSQAGEFWKLLMPGTHFVRVTDPKSGMSSKFSRVEVPKRQSGAAVRIDFQL